MPTPSTMEEKFPHRETPIEYASRMEAEDHERRKAIAMGDAQEIIQDVLSLIKGQ